MKLQSNATSQKQDDNDYQICWCAVMQYDGKEPFIFGTFFTEEMPSQNTIDDSMWSLFDKLSPTRPKCINQIAGSVTFIPRLK